VYCISRPARKARFSFWGIVSGISGGSHPVRFREPAKVFPVLLRQRRVRGDDLREERLELSHRAEVDLLQLNVVEQGEAFLTSVTGKGDLRPVMNQRVERKLDTRSISMT
jgi:hypothetical protein